jgi:hypothetical protein
LVAERRHRSVFDAPQWVLGYFISLLGGCATYQPPASIRDHVISLDSDALAHDPCDYGKKLGMEKDGPFDQYLDRMMAAMDQWDESRHDAVRKILIFVHGGLTAVESADQDAVNETGPAEDGRSYPIYIDWDSGFTSSYGEHVTAVSQGIKAYNQLWARSLLSPFYVVADIGRAVTRIPEVWSEEVITDSQTASTDLASVQKRNDGHPLHWLDYAPEDISVQTFKRLDALYADEVLHHPGLNAVDLCNDPERRQIMLSIGTTDTTKGELLGLGAMYAATIPPKFGLSWVVDGLGGPSWDNMIRRTLLIVDGSPRNDATARRFRKRASFENPDNPLAQEPVGPALLLIDKLADHLQRISQEYKDRGQAPPKYEVTLVGHSMGSMVINELLFRKCHESDVEFKNVVFLAAACSVRDCARCVVPYLRAHPATRFYNLCLHPTADLQERDAGDLPPRGSLLVWIDEFLADPPTMYDRTMGRWTNVLEGIGQFPQDIRGQMTIKAFNLRQTDDFFLGQPQKHSQFRGQKYWSESFWQADPPDSSVAPR